MFSMVGIMTHDERVEHAFNTTLKGCIRMICNKRPYDTEEKAIEAFEAVKGTRFQAVRYYRCNICPHWHLTTQQFNRS